MLTTVTYTVQTNSDTVPPIILPSGTNAFTANTLRAAVDSANNQPFPVVIQFNAAKFTGGAANTIALTSGLTLGPASPSGAHSYKIVGPTGSPVTVSGGNSFTVFTVPAGVSAEFDNLTIAHGNAAFGGGISSAGQLTLSGDTLASNVATSGGGGVYSANGRVTVTNSTFTGDSAPDGGGIYILDVYPNATPTLTGDTFNGDTAASHGGAVYHALDPSGVSATLTISGSKFNSDSSKGQGGAVYNSDGASGKLTTSITNSSFSNDSAVGPGGAVYSAGGKSLTLNTDTFTGDKSSNDFGGAVWDEDDALTIASGSFTGNTAFDGGGAVYFLGAAGAGPATLKVTNSTFFNDQSLDDAGGALLNGNGQTVATISGTSFTHDSAFTYGGAIYSAGSAGSLTLTGDTVSDDNANNQGGGVYSGDGTLTVTGATFANDKSSNNAGGAIYQDGATAVQIANSSFTGDSSFGEGGALHLHDNSGVVTVTNSTFSNDSTTDVEDGGAIYSETTSLTVAGSNFTGNNGSEQGGALFNDAGDLTVTGSTFTGNTTAAGGGAITDNAAGTTAITGSTFAYNAVAESDADGGAVASNATTLTLTGDTFTANSAGRSGGAVYFDGTTLQADQVTFAGNSAVQDGGALYGNATTSDVFDSTFAGNSAGSGDGGASFEQSATLNYANDTFYGNTAGAHGGGMNVNVAGTATVTDSTLSGNSASFAAGGGIYSAAGHVVLDGAIVAGNYVTGTPGVFTDLAGANGFDPASADDLIGDGLNAVGFTYGHVGTNFVGTDFTPIDAGLGVLSDHGGPTQTMKPAPNSLAIGNNSDFVVNDLNGNDVTGFDQRGVLRPQSQGYDIGAYQSVPQVTPDHFVFLNVPGSAAAGRTFTAQVEVLTPSGTPDAGFLDSVTLSSTDGAASLAPTALDFIDGVATFSATLNTTGPQKLTVTDTSVGSLVAVASSGTINVSKQAVGGTVSGTVFNDVNRDGAQGGGETGLVGWMAYIDLSNSGKFNPVDPQTTTGAAGQYTFSGLAAGTYIVRVVAPTGWAQTLPVLNHGRHVTIGSNGTAGGADFGFYSVTGGTTGGTTGGSINGTVFDDTNKDGSQDHGEVGLSGWLVYIDLSNSGKFKSGDPQTTTGADGQYTFIGLAAGTYIVRTVPPSGWVQTFPVQNHGRHVTIGSNGTAAGDDFGFYFA